MKNAYNHNKFAILFIRQQNKETYRCNIVLAKDKIIMFRAMINTQTIILNINALFMNCNNRNILNI